MKYPKNVDITAIFDQICYPIVSIQQYSDSAG